MIHLSVHLYLWMKSIKATPSYGTPCNNDNEKHKHTDEKKLYNRRTKETATIINLEVKCYGNKMDRI